VGIPEKQEKNRDEKYFIAVKLTVTER